ncbi:MAG: hypothetical protein AABZ74_14795 [Cyanobacteriota bacterium]
MKKITLLCTLMFITSCVSQPVNTNPVQTATPSIAPSTISKTPEPINSVLPSVVPTIPPVNVTASPIPTPIPTATSTPVVINKELTKKTKLTLGLADLFKVVTDELSNDYQKDIREQNEYVNELKPSFIIVEVNQKLVNPTFDAKEINWAYYDRMTEGAKASNTEIFFRIKFTQPYNDKTSPTISNYQLFIEKLIERYQASNTISFVIGDKINDQNTFSGLADRKDFNSFLAITYNTIRNKTKTAPIYLGTFVQSEFFSQNNRYRIVDDLLSFINTGADKYCDGFIFEIYSLATDVSNKNNETIFKYTNYKVIKDYYDKIQELITKKGLQNKKLILETGTFGGDLVESVRQEPQQQSNEIFKQIVYSASLGFDKVYLSKLFDKYPQEQSSIFSKFGLIGADNYSLEKKVSYWGIKLLLDRLKDTVAIEQIQNLPADYEGFIFEKEDKTKYYVVWNNNKDNTGSIEIKIEGKNAKVYTIPTDSERISYGFTPIISTLGKVRLDFTSNNMGTRIIESVN